MCMRKGWCVVSSLLVIMLILIGLGCTQPEKPKTTPTAQKPMVEQQIVIKFGDYGPFGPVDEKSRPNAQKRWMDTIEARTKGRIKFERYWDATLFSDKEALNAIGTKLADCGTVLTTRFPGIHVPSLLVRTIRRSRHLAAGEIR